MRIFHQEIRRIAKKVDNGGARKVDLAKPEPIPACAVSRHCPTGPVAAQEVRVYEWKIVDGRLAFRAVDDSSEGRKLVLGSKPWDADPGQF